MSQEAKIPYLNAHGDNLYTPGGDLITVKDVAVEKFIQETDEIGNITIPTSGWYWLMVDVVDPDRSEWYATYDLSSDKDGKPIKVPGGPNSPKKINGVRLWYDEKDASKSQLIFDEHDYNPEKGTVGEISPLVVKTNEGTFVAVQDANRFGLMYIEAFRRGWSRPKDEAPELKEINDQIKVTKYTDNQLGLSHSNNARIDAPAGKKAYISNGLTVLEVNGSEKPEIKGARWIELEEFITQTEEGMGKGVINAAIAFHYIDTDTAKLRTYLISMPTHVEAAKASVKSN